jgi:Protein of unknown function (DUF2587)
LSSLLAKERFGMAELRETVRGLIETIPDPAALARVAAMTQAMLEEAHATPLDDAGRHRLQDIHARAVGLVGDAVSPDLRDELAAFALPVTGDEATEAELRLAQAALIGWLNGIFIGVQTSAYQQGIADAAAQRQRALEREARDDRQGRQAYL